MSDITNRLRRWAIATDAVPASDLMDEAADEIERLRLAISRLADQDATLSVIGGNVIVQVDGALTNAEREAIEYCANSVLPTGLHGDQETADTLRALLERTK